MGVLLVGIQEARNEEDNRSSARYYILSSGTDDGKNLGVELWVSTVVPYATKDGRALYLEARHLRPLEASARHLVVRCQAPHLDMVILVAHALHHGKEYSAVER